MVFPFTVGVTPGVSEEAVEEEEVSWSGDEVRELLIGPGAISFRAIGFELWESSFVGGSEDVVESVDGLESASSLGLGS
jgi:hypothetical protein